MSEQNLPREPVSDHRRTARRLWDLLVRWLRGGHEACPRCHLLAQFTGAAPASPAEELVRRAAAGKQLVPLHRLEKQLAEALYKQDLRNGGWLLDIGVWGHSVCRKEAARALATMRPEFCLLLAEGEFRLLQPVAGATGEANVGAKRQRD